MTDCNDTDAIKYDKNLVANDQYLETHKVNESCHTGQGTDSSCDISL